jgi:hypothetical protein
MNTYYSTGLASRRGFNIFFCGAREEMKRTPTKGEIEKKRGK